MTPQTAQRTAQHARRLLTAHILTPHDYAVLDALLWRCRRPGRADLAVDYRTIARLAGVKRDAAINAVRKLVDLGLIAKIKRRVKVAWGRGCVASRQIANCYVFRAPATESVAPATVEGIGRIQEKESLLDKALGRLAGAAGFSVSG